MEQDKGLNDVPTEVELHEILERFFAAHETTHKAYDDTGPTGFVVIGFNRVLDPDLMAEDATADDKLVAMNASTFLSMPYVQEGDEGQIGPRETAPHGVHAVATGMMATALQQQLLGVIFQEAQRFMIERRRYTHD